MNPGIKSLGSTDIMSSADEKPPTEPLVQSAIEKEPTNGGGKNGKRQFFKADGRSDRDRNW